MKVKEIFYSLQGEGANSGMPIIFIRLSECNLNCSFCDTDFKGGKEMNVDDILEEIQKYPTKNILWTGGEPTLQLYDDIIYTFKKHGYWQAIETNGTNEVPKGLDYVTVSPKIPLKKVKKKIPSCDEIRIPMQIWDTIDVDNMPFAQHYFVSPIFNPDNSIDKENLDYCIEMVNLLNKRFPFRLSVQIHKFLNIK